MPDPGDRGSRRSDLHLILRSQDMAESDGVDTAGPLYPRTSWCPVKDTCADHSWKCTAVVRLCILLAGHNSRLVSRLKGTIRGFGSQKTTRSKTHVPSMLHIKLTGNKVAPSSAALTHHVPNRRWFNACSCRHRGHRRSLCQFVVVRNSQPLNWLGSWSISMRRRRWPDATQPARAARTCMRLASCTAEPPSLRYYHNGEVLTLSIPQ